MRPHARTHIATLALTLALPVLGAGCGWQAGTTDVNDTNAPQLTARHTAALYEGCTVDSYSAQRLATASARHVLNDVILLCLAVRADGTVHLRNTDGTEVTAGQVGDQIAALRAQGYRAMLGLTLRDDSGTDYARDRATSLIQDATFRRAAVSSVNALALAPDGYEIVLPEVSNSAALAVTSFVREFGVAFRAHADLGLFVPPSLTAPSDVPGGDAYLLDQLASLVDHVRLETLEFSCCNTPEGGPTIDAGWAVDAERFASGFVPGKVSVSVPLYGVDFANGGITYTNWDEASSHLTNASEPERTIAGTPHVTYVDRQGETHYVWYDDALSTKRMLYAWEPPTIPSDVGVVFWGLGAEDPSLWDALAAVYP